MTQQIESLRTQLDAAIRADEDVTNNAALAEARRQAEAANRVLREAEAKASREAEKAAKERAALDAELTKRARAISFEATRADARKHALAILSALDAAAAAYEAAVKWSADIDDEARAIADLERPLGTNRARTMNYVSGVRHMICANNGTIDELIVLLKRPVTTPADRDHIFAVRNAARGLVE